MSFNALDSIYNTLKRDSDYFKNQKDDPAHSQLKQFELFKKFITHLFREHENKETFTSTRELEDGMKISYCRKSNRDELTLSYNDDYDDIIIKANSEDLYFRQYDKYNCLIDSCVPFVDFWTYEIESNLERQITIEDKNQASIVVSGFYKNTTQNGKHLPKDINETIVGYFNIPEFRY